MNLYSHSDFSIIYSNVGLFKSSFNFLLSMVYEGDNLQISHKNRALFMKTYNFLCNSTSYSNYQFFHFWKDHQ
ncbi:MAG: hypothetical protein BAJALOKI1v1_1060002 [Promethearchaeota archaeon]|nr:MAG: hypothetical protein BAJALOKI1v1_1060002 [Candidatus Lokiarchaeota archaeon]